MSIIVSSVAELYKELNTQFVDVFNVNPRGKVTKELPAVQIVLTNPRSRLVYLPERKFSIVYATIESLLFALKEDKLKYFTAFNSKMGLFSDDGMTMHGAYGYRIAKGLQTIVDKLRKDKDTRQAVLTIYNYECDLLNYSGRDVPCTIALQFMLRDNQLQLIVTMRSNDAILGMPYDIYNFTNIQEVIANSLGVNVGTYVHQVGSLHVYQENFEIFEMMKNSEEVLTYNCNNLKEWKKQAKIYKAFVDATKKGRFDLFANSEIFKQYCKDNKYRTSNHMNIIANEILYKAGQKDMLQCPQFVEKFTQRWRR